MLSIYMIIIYIRIKKTPYLDRTKVPREFKANSSRINTPQAQAPLARGSRRRVGGPLHTPFPFIPLSLKGKRLLTACYPRVTLMLPACCPRATYVLHPPPPCGPTRAAHTEIQMKTKGITKQMKYPEIQIPLTKIPLLMQTGRNVQTIMNVLHSQEHWTIQDAVLFILSLPNAVEALERPTEEMGECR